ncbi:uncharacterized protein LOC107215096, partial [Parus major]|uniref:uncharacterized protein LOC107215096 n=1 Tax=Parus major TaxID=9157 RepID=UPI00077144D3
MLGGQSGGMRRCRGAALAALAAVLLVASGKAQVQQEPSLETTEGTNVTIKCSHPNIRMGDFIHFYRQLPGQGPEFLALIARGSKVLPDISGELWVSEDGRSSALWLGWPRRGDAAVYYCALGARAEGPGLRPGTNRRGGRGAALAALAAVLLVASGRSQVQQEPSLETTEDSGINITCSHPKKQIEDFIHFYRQLPGGGPEFLALIARGSKVLPDISGELWVSEDGRSSALWLGWPRRGDAAVYYCALGARAEGPGLRPGTNRRGRGRA